MINYLRRLNWIVVTQLGFDLRKFIWSLLGFPRFFVNYIKFTRNYHGQLNIQPCLHDWCEEGGATKSEYFLQDLYIAQKVFAANPKKHVDIGSRVDGFVANVASFRTIEVFDIRPITSVISGIIFRSANLMNSSDEIVDYCDSVSCLHALEHFGLGRYGDPIDPLGHVLGLKNIAKIVQPQGLLYLSVPVGISRVEFNAHRVLNPCNIVQLAEVEGLWLESFAWVSAGKLNISENCQNDILELSKSNYSLGIFSFRKKPNGNVL